ncbi:recombinase family protein [Kitasatospora sp. NPDC048365]|uniref:recombinase family protein n=1 Tax=Kitasatospora sp. NPDC048365 TaxID=3364050 RepID=UPI00371D6B43
MTAATPPASARTAPATAGYLRCCPEDHERFAAQWAQLRALAGRLGLPSPVLFLDRPDSRRGPGPALTHLLAAADAGAVRLVLVPDLHTFGTDETEAERLRGMLAARGARVLAARGGGAHPPGP